jgi:hypothetical protein
MNGAHKAGAVSDAAKPTVTTVIGILLIAVLPEASLVLPALDAVGLDL